MNIQSPKVSIGLPVYNGENFIRETIDSILAQTFHDFELVISDNASTDSTEAICRAYANQDTRVRYNRNKENIGAYRNFSRVFKFASGEYFKWAAHDDVCLPDYLSKCVEVLDQNPSIVLCHCEAASIDQHGQMIKKWDIIPELDSLIPHLRFRRALFLGEEIYFVWGLLRKKVLDRTPLPGNFLGSDRAFLSGMSLLGRFHQIPERLFMQREHPSRSVNFYNWRKPHQANVLYDPSKAGRILFPSWRLMKEHIAGIKRSHLRLRERKCCYREIVIWVKLNRKVLWTDLIIALENISGLKWKWLRRFDPVSNAIESLIPEGETLILVDEETFETEILGNRKTVPFLEKDGMYWGKPANDETAINELERLRNSGAKFIVFVKTTLWWLEYYAIFHEYLRSHYCCIVEKDQVVIYKLFKDP